MKKKVMAVLVALQILLFALGCILGSIGLKAHNKVLAGGAKYDEGTMSAVEFNAEKGRSTSEHAPGFYYQDYLEQHLTDAGREAVKAQRPYKIIMVVVLILSGVLVYPIYRITRYLDNGKRA